MKYPVGTKISSRSSTRLRGVIVEHDRNDKMANIVEWHEVGLEKDPWRNKWYDTNFDNDHDKILTLPVILPEELFTL